ncbi:MAG: prepilin-type N-terminal cleavage/methylation domain-containing protein [Clostridiaceae bacterium]|nr:prepilin-type N-terminal cleavage/methylation domain-containing protein [Clostridiaceae bacterium]
MMKFLRSNKGFTLVELLIVVVIIGILVAIAIPVYSEITRSAKERACESNVRIIKSAILQYQVAENGDEPDDIEDLAPYIEDFKSLKCPVEGTDYTLDNLDDHLDGKHNSGTGE